MINANITVQISMLSFSISKILIFKQNVTLIILALKKV